MDDEVWVTEDGRRIAADDLDLKHAQNIIRMIIRKRREREVTKAITKRLLKPQRELLINETDAFDWDFSQP